MKRMGRAALDRSAPDASRKQSIASPLDGMSFDISSGRVVVKRGIQAGERFKPSISLELGKWSRSAVDSAIQEVRRQHAGTGDRVAAWATLLLGTATMPESSLPILPRHEVRVRLSSLDCITLIYTCLALARARTFTSFVAELIRLRYAEIDKYGVDNHPVEGNFLDFACEALLMRGEACNVVKDVTAGFLSSPDGGIVLETTLQHHSREARLDPATLGVKPFYGERRFARRFIDKPELRLAFADSLRRGDIILSSKGSDRPTLLHHCFIATRSPHPASYIHASYSGYFYSPEACEKLRADPSSFPQFQCGVSRGVSYAGDEQIVNTGVRLLHPYYKGTDRDVDDAISHTFQAALVLRPQ